MFANSWLVTFPNGRPLLGTLEKLSKIKLINRIESASLTFLFIILGLEPSYLSELAFKMGEFLEEYLSLNLHPNKIILRKHRQGIDFLGYVALPYHRILRTKTRKRTIRKVIKKRNEFEEGLITEDSFRQSLNSYLGVLGHCNSGDLQKELIWLSGLADVEF